MSETYRLPRRPTGSIRGLAGATSLYVRSTSRERDRAHALSLHRDSLLSFDPLRLKENLGFQRCYSTLPEKSLSGNREIPKTVLRFLFLRTYSRSRDNPCFLASFTVIWPFLVFRRLQEQVTNLSFGSKVRSTLNMCWNSARISATERGMYSQLLHHKLDQVRPRHCFQCWD
jgi:hypothetical protein